MRRVLPTSPVPSTRAPRHAVRRPRRGAVAGPVVLAVLAVAGCSVPLGEAGIPGDGEVTLVAYVGSSGSGELRVRDDGAGQFVAVPAPSPGRTPDPARGGRPGAEPSGTAGRTGSGLHPVLDRAGLQELVTQQQRCDGDLLLASGDAVEVTGPCATLTVTGAGARVVAADVERLVVRADDVHVVVGGVDRVVVAGTGVRVAWEDALPHVETSGTDVRFGPVGVVRLDAGR
ncbi:hypothetical protein [Cellulomonas wangsupingiae]|uniref:hypothetical protein n=1 Tax=Cellulomonas wangsupingiae TaxID=2968085 RepID=UPI0020306616|nr:hypothetical protein [Cellulomonas wangsupingiae]MCM0640917.1 hypothetical protein [Cellulomonas wangsupingiae]